MQPFFADRSAALFRRAVIEADDASHPQEAIGLGGTRARTHYRVFA
jgi:hypothetical protein